MLYSNERKLALSGWLRQQGHGEYASPLKLQKFLFFYESVSKVENDKYDFSGLKGYRRGPVFSSVWGDYTKENSAFTKRAVEVINSNPTLVNTDRAQICQFIVRAVNEKELSDITHAMDIWSCKKDQIESGAYQVVLSEVDFSENDAGIINSLRRAFTLNFVKSTKVLTIGSSCFLFPVDHAANLTEQHYDTLCQLSDSGSLENPVYASLENGVIVID
jgi:uncharacterized phage-associated protein